MYNIISTLQSIKCLIQNVLTWLIESKMFLRWDVTMCKTSCIHTHTFIYLLSNNFSRNRLLLFSAIIHKQMNTFLIFNSGLNVGTLCTIFYYKITSSKPKLENNKIRREFVCARDRKRERESNRKKWQQFGLVYLTFIVLWIKDTFHSGVVTALSDFWTIVNHWNSVRPCENLAIRFQSAHR